VNMARWERLPTPAIPPAGFGWKKSATANPEFMHCGDRLLLYYRGTGVASGDTEERDQIGAAEVVMIAHRGIVVDDLASEPCIPSGGAEAFDADVLDPRVVAFKDEVLLYYSALGEEGDCVGLAVSNDGISFEKCGLVMKGRAPVAVVRNGKVFLLSQERAGDGYCFKISVSDDGRSFTAVQAEPVFEAAPGSWDGMSVVTAKLAEDGEFVYMIYGGSADTVDEPAYFGIARSKDLVHWERHPGNPIFGAGARGARDGGCIWFPTITETEDSFVMLYEGSRGTPRWDLDCSICMASVRK
jgi:predicted GH43/DUF377 family glycosyl hydrolase